MAAEPLPVTLFGLGEAGSAVAAHLVSTGATVRAFDPRDVGTPDGVERHPDPVTAAADGHTVLSLTAACDAPGALDQALDHLAPGTLYADLSTASPAVKRSLARTAAGRDLRFVDVALMGTVPPRGLRTPHLVAGPGAPDYVDRFVPLGADVEVVDGEPGDAATRKLLRSVLIKGLTAALIEGLRAAQAADLDRWLWHHLVEEDGFDEAYLRRLVLGTGDHARRRTDEMQAATDLLAELGVDRTMAQATRDSLHAIAEHGLPQLPPELDAGDQPKS